MSLRTMRKGGVGIVLAAAAAALLFAPAAAQAQLQLGMQDTGLLGATPSLTAGAYGAMNTVQASVVRIATYWTAIAPGGTAAPAGFDASNPGDPHYRWRALDLAVQTAAANHKRVLLNVLAAPLWAQGPGKPANQYIGLRAWDPNPVLFAQFMHALAVRYSGGYAGLPRVKDYEIWNEENLPPYLAAPDLPGTYRALLNAGYSAIKGVHSDNVAVMGGLAPVSYLPPLSMPALQFAADMMCLRRVGAHFVRIPGCQSAHFDVFADHPYTLAATPTKHAYRYDDVLIGDMQKLRDLLNAAEKLHTIPGHPPLWATEWAWISNPPNTVVGDSPNTAARYVAYAMYGMWKAGISMVIWQTIRDFVTADDTGAGLETGTGQEKPQMKAFAFPVIASVRGKHGYVWGRVPITRRVKVFVQHKTRRGWRTVKSVRSGRDGVFQARFSAKGNGTYRARVSHGQTSLGYWSATIPGARTHLNFYSG